VQENFKLMNEHTKVIEQHHQSSNQRQVHLRSMQQRPGGKGILSTQALTAPVSDASIPKSTLTPGPQRPQSCSLLAQVVPWAVLEGPRLV
jgi:hypothetical protein